MFTERTCFEGKGAEISPHMPYIDFDLRQRDPKGVPGRYKAHCPKRDLRVCIIDVGLGVQGLHYHPGGAEFSLPRSELVVFSGRIVEKSQNTVEFRYKNIKFSVHPEIH